MDIFAEKRAGVPVVIVDGVRNFDIGKIFDCGQCFRFEAVENSRHEKEFGGVAYGRYVAFGQDGDSLFIYGSDMDEFEGVWRRYLDIDRDYSLIDEDMLSACPSPILREAAEMGRGIRILSQEPFETVISFIVSQNNNIPRIKKIIEAMSLSCGEEAKLFEGYESHSTGRSSLKAFPTAEALVALGIEGLAELKTGFRAKYIYDGALKIKDGVLDLEGVRALDSTQAAMAALMGVKGIGRKVASCALLFGFGRYDAFPVDVWIKRAAEKYFPEYGKDFSPSVFGKYAGVAQQYLFYYERYSVGK